MAITSRDIDQVVGIAKDCQAKRVWLFGSALQDPASARDLDIACEGVPPRQFLHLIGRLLDEVEPPVDVVDMSVDNPFTHYVRKRAKLIYERG